VTPPFFLQKNFHGSKLQAATLTNESFPQNETPPTASQPLAGQATHQPIADLTNYYIMKINVKIFKNPESA
jgi:hypothetical protein